MYTTFDGIDAPEQLALTLERPQRTPKGHVSARVRARWYVGDTGRAEMRWAAPGSS